MGAALPAPWPLRPISAARQPNLHGNLRARRHRTFTPASLPGVATNTLGLAASGNTATLNIAIEQHP